MWHVSERHRLGEQRHGIIRANSSYPTVWPGVRYFGTRNRWATAMACILHEVAQTTEVSPSIGFLHACLHRVPTFMRLKKCILQILYVQCSYIVSYQVPTGITRMKNGSDFSNQLLYSGLW